MIPNSLSATSLQVAQLCLDRWRAEYMNRAGGFSNPAADVGSSVHGGLEMFVKAVYIDKTHAHLSRVEQKELLITYYQMSYVQTFGTADLETPEYKDGFKLSMLWFERTTWDGVEYVESCELKETIMVPFNHPDGTVHEIPFNYIMDRVDYLGNNVWRVVDYKTQRIPIQPDELEVKIQARAYALAIQIKHPEATKVVVIMDLLRHEPIGMDFTRDDNIAFWRFLCNETQRIVNIDESAVVPTLNTECRFCVKKPTCRELKKHVDAGGILGLDPDQIAERYDEVINQLAALNSLSGQLEDALMKHAASQDILGWETQTGQEVEIYMAGGRRGVNADRAKEILGDGLFNEYGKQTMTVAAVEELMKDPELPVEVRAQLKSAITKSNGQLKVKVKNKKLVI